MFHGHQLGPKRASSASELRRIAVRLALVTACVSAGGGFLLAVLWFDLMFDVQVLGHHDSALPEDVLASIAGYYRRVTTRARPMNRLIAATMLSTIGAIAIQIARGDAPRRVGWVSLVLVTSAVGLAGTRTVPARSDSGRDAIRRSVRAGRLV